VWDEGPTSRTERIHTVSFSSVSFLTGNEINNPLFWGVLVRAETNGRTQNLIFSRNENKLQYLAEVWWFKDLNVAHIIQNHLAHESSKSNIYKHFTWKFSQKSAEITDIKLQFGVLEWGKKRILMINKRYLIEIYQHHNTAIWCYFDRASLYRIISLTKFNAKFSIH
jgi:hypothetical protein